MKTKTDLKKLTKLLKSALDFLDKDLPKDLSNGDKASVLAGYISGEVELNKYGKEL